MLWVVLSKNQNTIFESFKMSAWSTTEINMPIYQQLMLLLVCYFNCGLETMIWLWLWQKISYISHFWGRYKKVKNLSKAHHIVHFSFFNSTMLCVLIKNHYFLSMVTRASKIYTTRKKSSFVLIANHSMSICHMPYVHMFKCHCRNSNK